MRTIELLGPLGAGVLTCLSYRLASVFALLLPSLGDLGAPCVCACVCACVRACMRACVRVCARGRVCLVGGRCWANFKEPGHFRGTRDVE